MTKQPRITFYVDIISPFGWLAYHMLRTSPTFKSVHKTYIPILLGGLHRQCGNQAPILVKNKDKWIERERNRWSTLFHIPLRKEAPPNFPVSTVTAMRALTALGLDLGFDSEGFAQALDAAWAALWCNESPALEAAKASKGPNGEYDIKDPATLKVLLASAQGVSAHLAEKSVARAGEKDVKDRLVAHTTEAFENGAFGIPWFQCVNQNGDQEGFFGFDHLGIVIRFLALDVKGDATPAERDALRALL